MNKSPVPRHLIDVATRLGIVPGAMIRTLYSKEDLMVPLHDQWEYRDGGIHIDPEKTGGGWILDVDGTWVAVRVRAQEPPLEDPSIIERLSWQRSRSRSRTTIGRSKHHRTAVMAT